eukprot:Colp12_sorted_trinity150504_noHs@6183
MQTQSHSTQTCTYAYAQIPSCLKIEKKQQKNVHAGFAAFEKLLDQIKSSARTAEDNKRPWLPVRALFDYDHTCDSMLPSQDVSLSFQYGDILVITNSDDPDWWQARKYGSDVSGLIPSKRKRERRERARQKTVMFHENPVAKEVEVQPFLKPKTRMSFRESLRRASTKRRKKLPISKGEVEVKSLMYVPSYTSVRLQKNDPTNPRPIVLAGPFKEVIGEALINHPSGKYVPCIPHTSRERRAEEVEGEDYYFVTKEKMEKDIADRKFIESGSHNGNLYGTSRQAVQAVIESGRHCVLDVSYRAIENLTEANMFPIVLFVRPLCPDHMRQVLPSATDEELEEALSAAIAEERQNSIKHTCWVPSYDSLEELVPHVLAMIEAQSTGDYWVPIPLSDCLKS